MENIFPKSVCVCLIWRQRLESALKKKTRQMWWNRYSHQSLESPQTPKLERKQISDLTVQSIFSMAVSTNVMFPTCRMRFRWKLIDFMWISAIVLVVKYHLEAFCTKSASEVSLPNRGISIYPAISSGARLSPCLMGQNTDIRRKVLLQKSMVITCLLSW